MPISQRRPRRKASGGRYHKPDRKKKQYELGDQPGMPRVGPKKLKTTRGLGGNLKKKVLTMDIINIVDPKTKKSTKVKITNVVDNAANRFYVRRNIITKGSIVETEKGKAKVTSRPAQDGCVNGVLVK